MHRTQAQVKFHINKGKCCEQASQDGSKDRMHIVYSEGPGQACGTGLEEGVLGHGSSFYLGGIQHALSVMDLEGAGRLSLHRDQSPPYSN